MLLSVEHIHKRYLTTHAVNDVSFHVGSDEIVALLGPNGAGKTSTVRMLIGLTEPDEGRITYHSLQGAQSRIVAGEMGYLPEERGLYPDQKILDVLVYFGELRGLRRKAARDAAGHWLERFQLADRSKEKVSALSKGNQQKVQLIAALLHKPRMVVLDEPFSGLDPVNQEMVLDLLRELRKEGLTILLSAHQMALIERLADRILLMNRGRCVLAGRMDELRRASGLSLTLTLEYVDAAPPAQALLFDGVADVHSPAEKTRRLLLRQDLPLNALLQQLGNGPAIHNIHSEATGLHEIYLRTVALANGETAAAAPGSEPGNSPSSNEHKAEEVVA